MRRVKPSNGRSVGETRHSTRQPLSAFDPRSLMKRHDKLGPCAPAFPFERIQQAAAFARPHREARNARFGRKYELNVRDGHRVFYDSQAGKVRGPPRRAPVRDLDERQGCRVSGSRSMYEEVRAPLAKDRARMRYFSRRSIARRMAYETDEAGHGRLVFRAGTSTFPVRGKRGGQHPGSRVLAAQDGRLPRRASRPRVPPPSEPQNFEISCGGPQRRDARASVIA